MPRAIHLAIFNDTELTTLLQHVQLSQGGVLPNIESFLLLGLQKSKVAAAASAVHDELQLRQHFADGARHAAPC